MDKLKIYLDHCCYNRPYDSQRDIAVYKETQAKLSIQTLVKLKAVELVYSSVSLNEIDDSPFPESRDAILEFIRNNAVYYVSKENNETAIALTGEIMKTGIKLKDASHAACAIIAKCDYLISTDRRPLQYKDNRIKMRNPIEFIREWRYL
jgi:predicted nucleic acid-binding protein